MKSAVKTIAASMGFLKAINHVTSNKINIMLYHGFREMAARENNGAMRKLLPIETFEEHVKIYVRYGAPLSLHEVVERVSSSKNGIVITLDDGYANNYHLAFPVLQKYQFPATIFLTTGFIDRKVFLWSDWLDHLVYAAPPGDSVFEWNQMAIRVKLEKDGARGPVIATLKRFLKKWAIEEIFGFLKALQVHLRVDYRWDEIPPALQPLRWEDIRAMQRSGLVSFGGHTCSHPILSRCTSEVQRFEVFEAKRRIEEELPETCSMFAYPNGKHGDYTEATKGLLREAGYTLAVTTESGYNRPSSSERYELRRWGADDVSSEHLTFLVSGGALISGYLRGRTPLA